MTATTLHLGAVRLTCARYADIEVDAATVGLTAEQVRAVSWAEPTWAAGDRVKVGAAAWIIDAGAARVVVDPAQAADAILRSDADAAFHQEAFAQVLGAAGVTRESVTHVVLTHLEGVGMTAWRNDDGTWDPFFPDAPILAAPAEVDLLDRDPRAQDPASVLAHLRAQGVLRAAELGAAIAPGVTLEHTGGHSPGHAFVRVAAAEQSAVMLGHLAISPLHLVTGECPAEHPDPATAERALRAARDEGSVLIGPLWPAPGAGTWNRAEETFSPLR